MLTEVCNAVEVALTQLYCQTSWTGGQFFIFISNKLAKLQATLVRNRNYDSLAESLTGVKCRATSVAKKRGKHHTSAAKVYPSSDLDMIMSLVLHEIKQDEFFIVEN